LAYLYFLQQFRRTESSVRKIIEGEGLFNADQVLNILGQFSDDTNRLEALKALTNYDNNKAQGLLTKIKDNIDVSHLQKLSVDHYRHMSGLTAIVFLLLAIFAFAYYFFSTSEKTAVPIENFEIFNHDRVVDLSDWKAIKNDKDDRKQSKVIWHDRLKIRRLSKDANEFILRRAVTGLIPPEFSSSTHRISIRNSKDVPLSGPRPIDRLFDVVIDVSNEPVNEWFNFSLDSLYWNVFTNPKDQWVAIPILFKTNSIRFELQSPNRTIKAFQREAYARSDNSGNHLVNEPTAELLEDGRKLIWHIPIVHENWIYKMAWEW